MILLKDLTPRSVSQSGGTFFANLSAKKFLNLFFLTVTANTRGGFTRNSALLWARGQDAFLVIHRSRD